jgi:hypothetical protein
MVAAQKRALKEWQAVHRAQMVTERFGAAVAGQMLDNQNKTQTTSSLTDIVTYAWYP